MVFEANGFSHSPHQKVEVKAMDDVLEDAFTITTGILNKYQKVSLTACAWSFKGILSKPN